MPDATDGDIARLLADDASQDGDREWRRRLLARDESDLYGDLSKTKGVFFRCTPLLRHRTAVAASVAGISREEWLRRVCIAAVVEQLGDDPMELAYGQPRVTVHNLELVRRRQREHGVRPPEV